MSIDTIKQEKKLLNTSKISIFDIRNELETENDDSFGDDIVFEAKINDQFKKYTDLVNFFSNLVLEYDEDSQVLKLNENFKAKNEYFLCLCLMTDNITEQKRQKLAAIFEEVVSESFKAYLGKNSNYKNIDNNDNQTIDIEKFCKDTFFENPQSDANSKFKNNKTFSKTDLIAWKSLDKRGGKIILLVQCKSGKNWRQGHPVNLNTWKQNIIDFATDPIRVYAITDLLEEDELLNYSREKGLILDRARIISLLANVNSEEIQVLRKKIKELQIE